MKKNFVNMTHIEGILYNHSLKKLTTGPKSKHPGTEYIRGAIDIATNQEMTNVVSVYFRYVTAVTSKGKEMPTFGILEKIINGEIKTVTDSSVEDAAYVSVNSSLALNDFYSKDDKLISEVRNENGFITVLPKKLINPDEKKRNTFKLDFLITKVKHIDEDEEKGTKEKAVLHGAFFDSYRKAILPADLVVYNPQAINYFENYDPSTREPMFTNLWGNNISTTTKVEKVEESAFGEAYVTSYSNTRKEFIVTGAQREPYEFGEDNTLTIEEIKKMMADREIALSTLKKNTEEWRKNASSKPENNENEESVFVEDSINNIDDDDDFDF